MKKILILPDAGLDNPFQHQFIGFLRQNGFAVVAGPSRRFFATLAAVSRHRPDVVYYDWIQSFVVGRNLIITLFKCLAFIVEILYLAKIKRIPVLHTLHNMRTHTGLWPRTEFCIYRFFLRRCTKIRVYSQSTRRKACLYFGLDQDRISVIQDVPYHHYYPNETTRSQSRQKLEIDPSVFVYLFMGLIKPYKGLEQMISTFVELHDPRSLLLLAGKSDVPAYEEQIKKQVGGNARIQFHNGYIPKENVQYYMNAADVVVLPFKNIEHSGTIDLAMSFNKAVITKKTPFTWELLRHQSELLFDKTGDSLRKVMQAAKTADMTDIGRLNFEKADQGNHADLLRFFEIEPTNKHW